MPDWSASPFSSNKDRKEGSKVKSQGYLRKPVVVNNEVNWGLNPDTADFKVLFSVHQARRVFYFTTDR